MVRFVRTRRPRVGRAALVALCGVLVACGSDDATGAEQPIDGTWTLEGLFQLDVEGTVQCYWSGTLELQQLPGGVNTVVGDGRYNFDCPIPGPPALPTREALLENARLIGTDFSLTLGDCQLVASYDAGRPELIDGGQGFCEVTFTELGAVFVAGAWRAHREGT